MTNNQDVLNRLLLLEDFKNPKDDELLLQTRQRLEDSYQLDMRLRWRGFQISPKAAAPAAPMQDDPFGSNSEE